MKPLILAAMFAGSALAAETPKTAPIDFLQSARVFSQFECEFDPKRSVSTQREDVFQWIAPGLVRISGQGWGYLQTPEEYRDYHLVLEYRWGEHTWGRRADRARDAGVFIHAHDRFGNWPKGVEAQLIEGGSGNLNVLDQSATKHFCSYRDPDWADVKGFRGPNDGEDLFGHWNRLEVIARGASVEVRLNGKVVNSVVNLPFEKGAIAIQSEEAEWFMRRWELHPLGTFEEDWEPPLQSSNTGSGADLVAREHALSPEDSLAAIEIDGTSFDLELVAAEPLVCDPVDVVWGEDGAMYVAEMRDYPLPPEHGPPLSRIRVLRDTDADGFPDTAKTWADQMDHVQGLLPLDGGILATTRRQIVHLRDTNGDDVADEQEVWFESNDPRHNQLQVSSPRMGPDGWVYFNNGLDAKEIYPGESEEPGVNVARRNFRIHPETRQIEAVSGYGQFGATIDPRGRRFSSSNRNPIMFAIMPLAYVERNPYAGLSVGHVDIAPSGGDSKVFPLRLSHTTAAAHLGTHTSSCGISWWNDEIFVCEPTGQLITRNRIEPDGASLKAIRVRSQPQTEFLRSRDEWFRPVNLRVGPDGALYICDMVRRFIDHARFFPEAFSETHYMRAGFDQGRIWRVVAKHPSIPLQLPDSPTLSSEVPAELEIAIPLATERLSSQPELLSRFLELSEHENARVRYLALLAIGDSEGPEVTDALKRAAIKGFSDPWMRRAILSGAKLRAGEIFEAVLRAPNFPDLASPGKLAFVREVASAIGKRADPAEAERATAVVREVSGDADWLRLAAFEGLGRSANLSPAELLAEASLALDPALRLTDRLAAVPLIRFLPKEQAVSAWSELLDPAQPPSLRQAAFEIAPRLDRKLVNSTLFERWKDLDPNSKAAALSILAKSPLPLLERMKTGEIQPALLDPMSRWVYLRSSNSEIRTLAEELFAHPSSDRAEVLESYLAAESITPEPSRGHQLFLTHCSVCHVFLGEGVEIGPDISDVRNKPWQALLSDILDPNRAVEARWTAHTVKLNDGRNLMGLISAESADAITLKGLGVNESLSRQEIASLRDLGQSLMPVGFEGTLDPQAMADLLAFLQGR